MRTSIVAALLSASAIVCAAQAAPTFDVVSVKPVEVKPPYSSGLAFQPGGRFSMANADTLSLIIDAFRDPELGAVSIDNVLNAPGWVRTQRFTIDARTGSDLAREPLSIMTLTGIALMRSLLEDRFKLQAHIETREQQVYALKLARADGTLGPKIHPSAVDCAALARDRAAKGEPIPHSEPGKPVLPCTAFFGEGSVTGRATGIATLAVALRGALRPMAVIDRTGLTGAYDFDLTYAPDPNTPRAPNAPPVLSDGPSIFTALQEQLGMKLEAEREERRVIVVDHIEMPTAN